MKNSRTASAGPWYRPARNWCKEIGCCYLYTERLRSSSHAIKCPIGQNTAQPHHSSKYTRIFDQCPRHFGRLLCDIRTLSTPRGRALDLYTSRMYHILNGNH